MKTLALIRSQPLPKLWTVFCANRRPAPRDALTIVPAWKKPHARGRT